MPTAAAAGKPLADDRGLIVGVGEPVMAGGTGPTCAVTGSGERGEDRRETAPGGLGRRSKAAFAHRSGPVAAQAVALTGFLHSRSLPTGVQVSGGHTAACPATGPAAAGPAGAAR
jgi:hypothetical protein